ncbi:hypothetical protein M885DRAFT_520462 [Pelagophyceae sp. CCMP2097]|nr:hypothetical protein M885DRAFT_520462 [Pelagophyceae sp. CCMP2097]
MRRAAAAAGLQDVEERGARLAFKPRLCVHLIGVAVRERGVAAGAGRVCSRRRNVRPRRRRAPEARLLRRPRLAPLVVLLPVLQDGLRRQGTREAELLPQSTPTKAKTPRQKGESATRRHRSRRHASRRRRGERALGASATRGGPSGRTS